MTQKPQSQAKDRTELQLKIMEFLFVQRDMVSTLKISKAVIGREGTTKDVNSALYDLEKKGIVGLKRMDSKPFWILHDNLESELRK